MTEEIYPTDDATVNSIHPDINDGDAKVLTVLRQFREDGSLWRNHTCLRFQLSEPLPTSATLHILCIDYLVHGHNLLLTSSSEDWDEDTITWNNRPEVELQEVIPTDDIIYGWNEITINPSLYHLGSGVISIVLSLDWSAPWSDPILNNQVAIRSKESSDPPYIKTQPKFKIRAMEDVSTAISGATVTVTGIGTKTTDSDGYTGWFYADYGTYLDVHITADGYESYNTGDYFSEGEDGMTWTHYLVPEAAYLNVTPLSHNSPAAGESFEISIKSNISWEAEDDATWVSIQVSSECGDNPQYGCGDGIITAIVDANPGTTSRTWHITVAGAGEPRTRTYTQSGAPCSSYTNESSCIAAGCFWYGGACHEYGPVQCSDYTDGLTCVANNCYWWSDGTCHDTEEPVPGAKGVITLCNINALSCPNCGTAEEGTEIEVIAEMENEGGSVGKFRFYIYDQDGNELSKEPDLPFPFSYKSVEAGATWKVEKTLLTNLNFNMIAKDLNGELRLFRQT